MLTREEDVDAHALHRQGWSISAIARHLGHDRKTIRAYLRGRVAGERKPAARADGFDRWVNYCRERLTQDPHLWSLTLFDEVVALGFDKSYATFTRQLRVRQLRPVCKDCASSRSRPSAVIDHPPGEETQWDWVELPNPPAQWGWPRNAQLLVGALAHSGKWRGVLCPSTDQPHLIDGLDRVSRALGGLTRQWRFDRMSTVCHPESARITATFAPVAKYYGVHVEICPAYRGQRKGVVEKANHIAAQRWWRTLPDEVTIEQAQASLDRWCATRGDTRMRRTSDGKSTVATVAAGEPLARVPSAPYPATLTAERKVSAQALVAFRGNSYSVPPELAHGTVRVSHRLGSPMFDIATTGGAVIARHRLAPDGAGASVRDDGHVTALNTAALAAFTTGRPHRRKERIPPSPAALAEAQALRNPEQLQSSSSTVVDLATYAAAAAGRNTLT